jgi:hypothetical protein
MRAKSIAKPVDGFGRGHTMARVIGMAIVLVPILVWFVWRDPGHVVSSTAATGTVAEFHKPIALLTLANGSQVRVYVGPRGATPGEELPLIADRHADGSVQYRVDLTALANRHGKR